MTQRRVDRVGASPLIFCARGWIEWTLVTRNRYLVVFIQDAVGMVCWVLINLMIFHSTSTAFCRCLSTGIKLIESDQGHQIMRARRIKVRLTSTDHHKNLVNMCSLLVEPRRVSRTKLRPMWDWCNWRPVGYIRDINSITQMTWIPSCEWLLM